MKVILQSPLHLPQRFKEAALKVAVASEVDVNANAGQQLEEVGMQTEAD